MATILAMKIKKLIVFTFSTLILLTNNACFLDSGKGDFLKKFDLKLKGQVLSIKETKTNHHLVCLKVIESNKKRYFPLFEPFKSKEGSENNFNKRFFIKVQDSLAVIILYNGEMSDRILHNKIKNNSIIEINMDGKKSYQIFDSKTDKYIGGRKIPTSPVRNNIEISCLENKL